MSKRQRPWMSPQGHIVVGRRWRYAPPSWVMYEALVDEHDRWLSLMIDELQPKVVASQRPSAVIYQPWVDPRISAVEVRIEPPERPGTGAAITVLAYADQEALPPEERRWVRYRLGTLFGAALRKWVDEPHW